MSYESRLETLSKKAMAQLDAIGIAYTAPVDWKLSNATSTFGTTKRVKNVVTGKCEYHIRISRMTLDESVSDDRAMDTIIHELIHTVSGCFDHGPNFKKMAELVNDCYACYNISRTSTIQQAGLSYDTYAKYKKPQSTQRFTIVCARCGKSFVYKRKTQLVKTVMECGGRATTGHWCPYCNCHTFILK